MFSLHTQWPVTREISNSSKFRRVWPARWSHDALQPFFRIARFLPPSWLVQRSLVGGTSKFRCVSTATSRFGKLICDPTFCLLCLPMFHRSLQGWFPCYGSLCVRSSWRRRVANSVLCSRFIVGICINFPLASCTHLSFALFFRSFSFCFVFIEQVSS